MSRVLQLNKRCRTFISPATGNDVGILYGGQTVRVTDKNADYLLQAIENPGSENEYPRFIEVEGADYDFPVDVDAEMIANDIENIKRTTKNLPPIDLLAQREAEMNGEEYIPVAIVSPQIESQRDSVLRAKIAGAKAEIDAVEEALDEPPPVLARRTAAPIKSAAKVVEAAPASTRRRAAPAQHSRDAVGTSERATVTAESVLRAKSLAVNARRLPSRAAPAVVDDVPMVDPEDDSAFANPERAARTSSRTLQRQQEAAARNGA